LDSFDYITTKKGRKAIRNDNIRNDGKKTIDHAAEEAVQYAAF